VTPFADLSDGQLLAEVKRLAATERRATAALIRSLMELDARRLYLGEGCSLFTYCTRVLHLAEGAAYNRFPMIVAALEDGSLTMTAVRLLAPHLTAENHQDVLASARHQRKADIERLVASLTPKPDAPAAVRKVPLPRHAPPGANTCAMLSAVGNQPAVQSAASAPAHAVVMQVRTPPRTVTPLAPARYKLQLTISSETHDKWRRVQDLVRHAIPDGDPAEILDRALTLLLNDLERRRCAVASSPRRSKQGEIGSRYIPAAVKREVWRRDEGRCAFVGTNGRCTERAFLEFHHVQPYSAGGPANASNIELRCRAHNRYEASLLFAGDHVADAVGWKCFARTPLDRAASPRSSTSNTWLGCPRQPDPRCPAPSRPRRRPDASPDCGQQPAPGMAGSPGTSPPVDRYAAQNANFALVMPHQAKLIAVLGARSAPNRYRQPGAGLREEIKGRSPVTGWSERRGRTR
jgi:5-methylcytosine-specific restriction endonuclease McrA